MPTDSFSLPAKMGMRRIAAQELRERGHGFDAFYDLLLVWEPPRLRPRHRDFRYVISADVGDGIGQDLSVVDVLRIPTLEEPAEQVAQWASTSVSPEDLAPVIDAIGRWYADADSWEAQAAIEINNHGKSTQDLLQKHYGYTHFYRWQYVDKAQLDRRFSQAIGWSTTPSTRPILLSRFATALKQLDPVTGHPGIIIHSAITFAHLADFYSPTGRLIDAEATKGAHDDAVISLAIAHFAAEQLLIGESEPMSDRRARWHLEQQARQAKDQEVVKRDWRNTDSSFGEAQLGLSDVELAELSEPEVEEMIEYAARDSGGDTL